jgi:capsular polysaccharide biosynthesis protein
MTDYPGEISVREFSMMLKKRRRLIVFFFFFAVTFTAVVSYIMPPVYRSSFIVRGSTPPVYLSSFMVRGSSVSPKEPAIFNYEVIKTIDELDDLRKEKRTTDLAEALDLDEKSTIGIAKLKATSPSREQSIENVIEITIDMYSPTLTHKLAEGIVKCINQNPYINQRVLIRKQSLTHLKDEIQAKIADIEMLRNTVIRQIREDRHKQVGFNPIGLDTEVITLRQRLVDIDNELKLLKGFEISMEPVVPKKPVKPRKVFNIAFAGITALFMGVLISLILEWIGMEKRNP